MVPHLQGYVFCRQIIKKVIPYYTKVKNMKLSTGLTTPSEQLFI